MLAWLLMADILEPKATMQDSHKRPVPVRPVPQQHGFRQNNLLLWAVVLACGASVLFFGYGVNSKARYSALLKDYEKLQASISDMQSQNQSMKSQLEKVKKEKEAIQKAIDEFKTQNDDLNSTLKNMQAKLGATAEEKGYLEEILLNKNKELEKLKTAAGAGLSGSVDIGDLGAKLSQKDAEIQRLMDQNQTLQNKLEKVYKAASDKIAAINEAQSVLESTLSEAKKSIDSEFSTVDLGAINVMQNTAPVIRSQASAAPAPAVTPAVSSSGPRAAKTQGKVLAVNEDHGFVVIDMGKIDGVTQKSTFTVKKKSGEVIGSLSVLEIRDVMTACNVGELKPKARIEVNDVALLQK